MNNVTLTDVAVVLAALAIAAPLARMLGIGTVLGYLVAGILLGPYGIQQMVTSREAKEILEFSEFGIVLLLFMIGLELRPRRLWSMRNAIFGLGGAQVAATATVLAVAAGLLFGLAWQTALFAGLALALSSTAFALQVLEETGDLPTRHGRLAFSVLLFQDLAAIPLIALVPLFAVKGAAANHSMDLWAAAEALGTIAAVVLFGMFVVDHLIRLVALTKVREAMTAAALLTVVTASIAMQEAGISASLGAFLAGALLAESSYRHQLEADIAPFEGLLLGLFFTAVGMTLNIKLLFSEPWLVLALTAVLIVVKSVILTLLGLRQGLGFRPARRLGLSLSQGGEFAFVLFAAGVAGGVMPRSLLELLSLVVTLSMAATPLLLLIDTAITKLVAKPAERAFDALPDNDGHVVIAGFGRYGQIIARVLRGKGIPFTALDFNAEQVELVKRFGAQAFYGDAARPDILAAAQMDKARAFVLATDDVEHSLKIAEVVTATYPKVPIFARARNRNHVHQLYDLGIRNVQRETFLSALETTRQVLRSLGLAEREVESMIRTFKDHDERRLKEDYAHYTDEERMRAKARSDAATLEKLFADDSADAARPAEKVAG